MRSASCIISILTRASRFGNILVIQCPSALRSIDHDSGDRRISWASLGCRQLYSQEKSSWKVQRAPRDITSANQLARPQPGMEQCHVANSKTAHTMEERCRSGDGHPPDIGGREVAFTELKHCLSDKESAANSGLLVSGEQPRKWQIGETLLSGWSWAPSAEVAEVPLQLLPALLLVSPKIISSLCTRVEHLHF